MFEKEAEEYKEMNTPLFNALGKEMTFTYKYMQQSFQDGAEFGYNKANEWHYVKDGDFPTEITEKPYLVALKSEYTNDFFFEIDIWCWSLHCFASNNPKKVYAWKEIVPPKEKE